MTANPTPDQYTSGKTWSLARYGTTIVTTASTVNGEVSDDIQFATEAEAIQEFANLSDPDFDGDYECGCTRDQACDQHGE